MRSRVFLWKRASGEFWQKKGIFLQDTKSIFRQTIDFFEKIL